MESSSTNVHVVGVDLLKAFYKLWSCFSFVIQVISEKNTCSKGFTRNFFEIFLHKNNLTIIPTNLVRISFFIYFYPFLETKNKNQIFWQVGGLVTRNICFLFIASRFKVVPNLIDFHKGIFLHVTLTFFSYMLWAYIFPVTGKQLKVL